MMCRVVNVKQEQADVYIGRGSKWGNPFKMRADTPEERDRVLQEYERYFWTTGLSQHLHELAGKTLGCYCAPKRCHGDYLAMLVNRFE